MVTHYFASSWPTISAGIQFSQHHTVYDLQSTCSAPGLTDLSTYTITLSYYSLLEDQPFCGAVTVRTGMYQNNGVGKGTYILKIILLQNTISMIKFQGQWDPGAQNLASPIVTHIVLHNSSNFPSAVISAYSKPQLTNLVKCQHTMIQSRPCIK